MFLNRMKILEKHKLYYKDNYFVALTKLNHFDVRPVLDARVFVKHRFHRAYARLGELFQRGRHIFDTTIDTFKDETASYFENLANYYKGVYTQYTSNKTIKIIISLHYLN